MKCKRGMCWQFCIRLVVKTCLTMNTHNPSFSQQQPAVTEMKQIASALCVSAQSSIGVERTFAVWLLQAAVGIVKKSIVLPMHMSWL